MVRYAYANSTLLIIVTVNLKIGDKFPDFQLPSHTEEEIQLSQLTQSSIMDKHLGFFDGYPLIVVFYRGFFCPRDLQQMRQLVQFQDELKVNYCRLTSISVDPPIVQAAFRAGLGAEWTFLSDRKREAIAQLNIIDETEGEYANCAQPYTFVLRPDLTIHKIYNGWFFIGRPTLEELRLNLREIMETFSNYRYEAYNTPEVKKIRIPQQEWGDDLPVVGANGSQVGHGVVREFNLQTGNGTILQDDGEIIFFNFTAIPGKGYRTIQAGTQVIFEVVNSRLGLTARNIQKPTP
ncbi:redoxin domain-containing protein [Mastigocoleus sp. MO_188.B34]|uniref:redoxin domain-containing protein n=1 Tax=Mastigocoleus sp. MO_188.B34 TaxID=3036635 RepID=UPI002627B275|nr:redoxin domain-containing protein [Mastigocoleus sp. MO_188.B34]MDJ0694113.1 redoxin domain-containing protein [Mastigocoleus sp. MO_188.B34]